MFGLKIDKKAEASDIQQTSNRKWWLIGLGIAVIGLGLFLGMLWGQQRDNILLAFLTLIMLPGGGYLAYRGWGKRDEGLIITPGGQKFVAGPVNSINISPDSIDFVMVKEPKGHPQEVLNFHKYFYVNIFDEESGGYKPLTLPDTKYRDPREMANILNLPAHRRLISRRPSLVQKIAPFAILIAICIVGFLHLVLGGSNGG